MLSICIPTYNFDASALIVSLQKQIDVASVPVELLIIDDASDKNIQLNIERACVTARFIALEKNIGRSRIRNFFLTYATYPYFLFLDGDSIVSSSHFIQTYIDFIVNNNTKIVCGGRIYPEAITDRTHLLRWRYGHERESVPAEIRCLHPHQSFMTNNVVIHRDVLQEIGFDETLQGYGHEDTLFGVRLLQNNIPVSHINNPILNGDIESNIVFVEKSESALKNLATIYQKYYSKELITTVSLLRIYEKVRALKLISLYRCFYQIFKYRIRQHLLSGDASVLLFNLYKLGYFSDTMKK